MPKVEAQDNVDIDDEEGTEDDLKILNEMDIDKDFNIWSDFRNSFSVAKKDSISQLNIACSGKLESSFSESLGSISEHDQAKLHHDETDVSPACSRASQHVRFSPLSLAERRNICASVVRLERKQVFSRYYFPETWELREKEAIQRELLLKEPLVCSGIKVCNHRYFILNFVHNLKFSSILHYCSGESTQRGDSCNLKFYFFPG